MIDGITIILLCLGLLIFLATSAGILRFPDFYTRIHASSKGDTLSTMLLLSGFILYNLHDLHNLSWVTIQTSIKILIVVVFIFITSPTSSHALIDAGYETKIEPWQRKKGEEDRS